MLLGWKTLTGNWTTQILQSPNKAHATLKRCVRGWFHSVGSAYALEHATRPSNIGLTLSSSPLALFSWVGESFLEWTDEDLDIHVILEEVTLY